MSTLETYHSGTEVVSSGLYHPRTSGKLSKRLVVISRYDISLTKVMFDTVP